MKRAITSVKSTKLLRRVLSKTSTTSKTSDENRKPVRDGGKPKRSSLLEQEIANLKEQVKILQITISSMREEIEKKDLALAGLAREKEKLSLELKREKRAHRTLKQQLEEERVYYYKEKEQYCHEMNTCKKLKKKMKGEEDDAEKDDANLEIGQVKNDMEKLKEVLSQTLEANYNLSIKFLRMKNTKSVMKSAMKELGQKHEKEIADLKKQLEDIKGQFCSVEKNIKMKLSPSSKRYLQIVKQNGFLMHQNLCLQLEVDRLAFTLENYKMKRLKSETNNQLKLINSKSKGQKQKDGEKGKIEGPHRREKPSVTFDESEKVVKIYERKKVDQMPEIFILEQLEENSDESNVKNCALICPSSSVTDARTEISESSGFTWGREAVRTQSAPEVVQSSIFNKDSRTTLSTDRGSINTS